MRILVIGGTGPTGPFIVNGLVARGHQVTVFHTGRHEVDSLPPESVVPHIHGDPFNLDSTSSCLDGQTWDVVFAMYGRLRMLVQYLIGKTPRLFSIGGVPVYPGFANDVDLFPPGMRFPSAEEHAYPPLGRGDSLTDPSQRADHRSAKVGKIIQSEAMVFEHHPDATHFRYPYIYGPHQVVPKEWPIVKRALDGRRPLILADGGRTVESAAYVENVAAAVLAAVDRIDISAGRVYNVADSECYSRLQVIRVVEEELGHLFEHINLPFEVASPAYPTIHHHSSQHRIVDTTRIRQELGYVDVVPPLEAMRHTIGWQVTNLPADHERVMKVLQDPFDYAAEDRLAELYRRFVAECAAVPFERNPGYSSGYYGPEENPGGTRAGMRST